MITVILPVKNVEHIIGRYLEGVAWADEVLLVNGGSTDGTLEIAARFQNVRVVQHSSHDTIVDAFSAGDSFMSLCFSRRLAERVSRLVMKAEPLFHRC